ncbi:alpha carbonic anhydrase 7-like isoform X2 [Humulus lupulus]|nr:alpha carbonic anhydrase 7-like isoform X2 [Humulus lupulus]
MGFFSFLFLFTLFFIQPRFIICRALESETDDESPFSYIEGTGKGPKKWGEIDPHWKICDKGKLQSPIDLLDQRVQVFPNLGKLKRDYRPAPATVRNRGHDITV